MSSRNGSSSALLLPRSRTSGAQDGQSTHTWWTRTPPPLTLPGARRVRRTPSSSSRKRRVFGTSLRDPRPRREKPLNAVGAQAGTGRTQHCTGTCVVTNPSSAAVPCSRCCRDLVGSLPWCRAGQKPVHAGEAHSPTSIPPEATPGASSVPSGDVREHGNSTAPVSGGMNGLLYLPGPCGLYFPCCQFRPCFGDPLSSPCLCRAWLFYPYRGVGLIKVIIFLHVLAVVCEYGHPVLYLPASQDGLVQPGRHRAGHMGSYHCTQIITAPLPQEGRGYRQEEQ